MLAWLFNLLRLLIYMYFLMVDSHYKGQRKGRRNFRFHALLGYQTKSIQGLNGPLCLKGHLCACFCCGDLGSHFRSKVILPLLNALAHDEHRE